MKSRVRRRRRLELHARNLCRVLNEEPYRAHASIWMQVKVLQGEGLTNHSLPLVRVANREVCCEALHKELARSV